MRFIPTLLACTLVAAPLYSAAQVSININVPGVVTMAPPPPRYEPLPPPRSGYVWVPGNWQWHQDAYGWRQGYWEPSRRDYAYAPGRWVRADGGWRWVEPQWKQGGGKHGGKHHDHGDDYHHDGHHGGDHCPPGQAKKGRC